MEVKEGERERPPAPLVAWNIGQTSAVIAARDQRVLPTATVMAVGKSILLCTNPTMTAVDTAVLLCANPTVRAVDTSGLLCANSTVRAVITQCYYVPTLYSDGS